MTDLRTEVVRTHHMYAKHIDYAVVDELCHEIDRLRTDHAQALRHIEGLETYRRELEAELDALRVALYDRGHEHPHAH